METKEYNDKRILFGFILIISVVLLLCFYFYFSTKNLVEAARTKAHSAQVISTCQHILSAVIDMETAQRGYIITFDESYLEPYQHASDTLVLLIENLRTLTAADTNQTKRISRLESRIEEKSNWVTSLIEARKVGFADAQQLVVSGIGKEMMDQIRDDILAIKSQLDPQESAPLDQDGIERLQYSFLGLLFLLVVMITALFYFINKNLNSRIEAALEIHSLYNEAPCGYLSVDASITLTNINKTLLDWMGYTREEVVGKMKYPDLLNPESRQKFLASFEEDFNDFQQTGSVTGLEFQFQRKDGSSFEVIVNSMATYDTHGNFIKSRTTVFDNTERKITERNLLLATERIHDLYNYAPCGYHSLDEQGNVLEMNQTELQWLGYTLDELKGRRKFTDFITTEGKELFKNSFPEFKQQGFISNLEFDLRRRDGSHFPVIISATAIYDEDGNFVRSRSTVFDNTARKAAEEEALMLSKELEAFSYSVSHDLRAPLRSINGYAQILKEDFASTLGVEGNRTLDIIMRNAIKMGALIDDLLEFSRMGRKEVLQNRVNMDGLVAEILESLVTNTTKKIELNVQPLGLVKGDMSMLKQVWINLVSNALKYSSKQDVSRIEIGKKYFDSETHYFVKDNGVGFDMKYSNKLFEVFQRLHKVQDFDGTGVGLALVKRIVTRHGGKVWAEATTHEGATFYFSLPNN